MRCCVSRNEECTGLVSGAFLIDLKQAVNLLSDQTAVSRRQLSCRGAGSSANPAASVRDFSTGALTHLMIRSAPYRIAESFIRSNPVIEDELGPVRGVNLELTGNSVSYAGPEGRARFAFDVQGSSGKTDSSISRGAEGRSLNWAMRSTSCWR
jgi:hypothetical protein